MRKKIPDEEKRKKISFTVDPRLYEIWKKYCEENNIENQSEFIEKMIKKKIEKTVVTLPKVDPSKVKYLSESVEPKRRN